MSDINTELEQSVNDLNSFNRILLKNSNNTTILAANTAIVSEEEKEAAEQLKKLKGVAKTATAQFGTFTKSLLNSGSSFEPIAAMMELVGSTVGNFLGIFGPIGKFFGGVSEAMGNVGAHLVRSMDKAYTSFEKMSQNGVVSSFTDMQKAGTALGFSITEMESLFTKSSKDIALLGGSAVGGRIKLEQLGTYSRQARKEMQRLGISATDFTEFQISVLNQRQRYQGTQIKIDDDAVKITENYALELKTLSDITGMSMKQHDDYNKKLMESPEYVFQIMGRSDLSDKVKDAATNYLQLMNAAAPELAKMTLGGLSNFGIGRTQQEQEFFSRMAAAGIDFMTFTKDFTSGKMDEFEAVQKTVDVYKKMIIRVKETVGEILPGDDLYAGYVQMQTFITQYSNLDRKQYQERLDANKKISKEQTGVNSQLGDTKTNLRDSAIMMEKLTTSSDNVVALMDFMSEAMFSAVDKMYDISKLERPESLKIQKKLIDAQKELGKQKKPTEDEIDKWKKSGTLTDRQQNPQTIYENKMKKLTEERDNLEMQLLDNKIKEGHTDENSLTKQVKDKLDAYRTTIPNIPKEKSSTPTGASTGKPSTVPATGGNPGPLPILTEHMSKYGPGFNTGGIVQNTNTNVSYQSDQSEQGTDISQRSLPGSLNIDNQDNKLIENMSTNLSDKFAILIDLLESSNSMSKKKMQATMA